MILIDADLVAYRCAATAEEEPVEAALERAHRLMETICYQASESEQYRAFLTGSGNFRKKINPEYKANRKDKPLPKWLQQTRNYLILEWGAETSQGCEADDLLGINQTDNTVIASLDKDLLMIPGQHFNWVNMDYAQVDYLDGLKQLYRQMLIGDKADNITGVAGLGKVKAGRIIDPLENEEDMFNTVLRLYDYDYDRFVMNAQCLWIMQKEGEYWTTQLLNEKSHLISEDPLLLDAVMKCDSMTSTKDDTLTTPTTTQTQMSGGLDNATGTEATPLANGL